MALAKAISSAEKRELADLAAYLVMECKMRTQDVHSGDMIDLNPTDLAKAVEAWAFIQQNQRDGDD